MREIDEQGTVGLRPPLRRATKENGLALAELVDIAGDGIPSHLWSGSAKAGQSPVEVGVERVSHETANFSYRNAVVAEVEGKVAAMMLAYRLPDEQDDVNLEDLPDLIRPLVQLELEVPGSFYINALAAYPEYRGLGFGTKLLEAVHTLASEAGCETLSLEVFERNEGAVRLYERHGYKEAARLPTVPHPSFPYEGDVVLMTRSVET